MSATAVLLPARIEARLDERGGGPARLRVIVVPDRAWLDSHHGATDEELDLLELAVSAATGPLLTGQPYKPGGEDAYRTLADQVGPGRARWLADSFVVERPSGGWGIDRTGPRGSTGAPTRINGLPADLELHAMLDDDSTQLLDRKPLTGPLILDPDPDAADGRWPSWDSMSAAGLAFDLDPCPVDPAAIRALLVVGVGDGDTGALFESHRNTGDLGMLVAGQPTNTVAGGNTVNLGTNPDDWRTLVRERTSRERALARLLTGDQDAGLVPLPGGGDADLSEDLRQIFIDLLFPGIAGFGLREIWGTATEQVYEVADWAALHLYPEGPVPPVRIGRQPYGVWPVAPWGQWPDDGPVPEQQIVAAASNARDRLAGAAGTRNVVGADAGRLWDLMAQTPVSTGFDAQLGIGLETLRDLLGGGSQLDEWGSALTASIAEVAGRTPLDPVVSLGPQRRTLLAPVVPRLQTDSNGRPMYLYQPPDGGDADANAARVVTDSPGDWIPHACQWLYEEFFMETGVADTIGQLEEHHWWWPASLWWRLTVISGLLCVDQAVRPYHLVGDEPMGDRPLRLGDPPLHDRLRQTLPGDGSRPEQWYVERFRPALLRLIEFASSDASPEFVQLLERTMSGLLDVVSHRVDPWLTGAAHRRLAEEEGPRPLGIYGWIDGPLLGQPGPDPEAGLLLAPSMDQARLAAVLRDKALRDPEARWNLGITSTSVRAAQRLAEDVRTGAHPAEAVGREVERILRDRPLIDAARDHYRVREEHAGRRTCDGLAALTAARGTGFTVLPDVGAATSETVAQLAELDRTLDTLADLLVVEAARHSLDGRPEAAAHALDFAAGLLLPPELSSLATPPAGHSVRTTVLTVLPVAVRAKRERSPVAIAAPALAQWLDDETGPGDGTEWTWDVAGQDSVRLSDLGLVPADALTVAPGELTKLVRLSAGVPTTVPIAEPAGPATVRRLATVVGPRPPSGTDLGLEAESAATFDGSARRASVRTLAALRAAARRTVTELRVARTRERVLRALTQAVRWSISLAASEGEDLVAVAEDAARQLDARIAAMPLVGNADGATILDLIAGLVGVRTPIMLDIADVAALNALHWEQHDGRDLNELDSDWLEVIAAVRPPLARLEAHQYRCLTADRIPFVAASNHPNTPWLGPPPSQNRHDVPHLLVAYGPTPAAPAGAASWSVLDSYAEVVPTSERRAGLSMRFNMPAAQAPNAILVAVTPRSGDDLTPDLALQAVLEARSTARARMARPEDLGAVDPLSGPWLPAFEQGAFQVAVPASQEEWA